MRGASAASAVLEVLEASQSAFASTLPMAGRSRSMMYFLSIGSPCRIAVIPLRARKACRRGSFASSVDREDGPQREVPHTIRPRLHAPADDAPLRRLRRRG